MLKKVLNRKKLSDNVSSRAASWWSGILLDPYKVYYNGSMRFKIQRDNTLSLEQVMIFEDALREKIKKQFKANPGLYVLHDDDNILKEAAEIAHIPDFPMEYFPQGASMNIESFKDENNPEIYVYMGGMKRSERIR